MNAKTQQRDECQVCGRNQAVRNNRIAKHGYTRPGIGWLVGGCPGSGHAPFPAHNVLVDSIERATRYAVDQERLAVETTTVHIEVGLKYVGRIRLPEVTATASSAEEFEAAIRAFEPKHRSGKWFIDAAGVFMAHGGWKYSEMLERRRAMHARQARETREWIKWAEARVAEAKRVIAGEPRRA